jgi:NAD(P) transhydrogenase subunit alpha
MIVGIPKETYPGERRVALTPSVLPSLAKAKIDVSIESGAGDAAGITDAEFREKGARIVASRAELFSSAQIICQVRALGANPDAGRDDLALIRPETIVVGMAEPLWAPQAARDIAQRGATLFALELIPRITRAQSMDVLTSMATIAGYKAVVLAADTLPKMFPLLMTPAGTLQAARVFIIGAGVAGLEAIGIAKKLGAVVEAYDVRPVVKEQVESLGGKFVQMELDTKGSEGAGGYAKELGEEFYRKQRELMLRVIAASDVVITTALIPGKRAPVLVTREMVEAMRPGSVVVDLAAERGGNCELTEPGQTAVHRGVTILGPTNPASDIPFHASQMYAKNVVTFLLHLVKDGQIKIDPSDEITREVLVTRGGDVVNPRVRDLLGAVPASAGGRP